MTKVNVSLILAGTLGIALAMSSTGCSALLTNRALAEENERLRKENRALEAQFEEEDEEATPAAPAKAEKATEETPEKPSAEDKMEELKKEKAELEKQLKQSEANASKLRKAIAETPPTPAEQKTAPAAPWNASYVQADPRLMQCGTVGPSTGYVNLDPMDTRPCDGMCWGIKNQSRTYMAVYVDGREMTICDGFRPVLPPANVALPGGDREKGQVSVVRPGQLVKFLNGSVGNHTVRLVFYTHIPGQALQPSGTAQRTFDFPRFEGGAWGLLTEISRPDEMISMY